MLLWKVLLLTKIFSFLLMPTIEAIAWKALTSPKLLCNLTSRYLTTYTNVSAPQMDGKRKGWLRVHFSTTRVSQTHSRSLAFTDDLDFYHSWVTAEAPMTFSDLPSCRDRILNHTHHTWRDPAKVQVRSESPGFVWALQPLQINR